MRLLFLNQFFWPDLAPTSQLLTDVCDELAAQGHEVHVVCGRSAYMCETGRPKPKVNVIHAPAFRFSKGRGSRTLSYLSFLAGAAWKAWRAPKPDIVVSMTTPPLLSVLGSMLQRWHGARHYIWEMDMYPDVAVDTGLARADAPFVRLLAWIARRQRRRADGVIALGECMKARLVQAGAPAEQIQIAENWADSRVIRAHDRSLALPLTVVYPGNLGMAHDAETLAGAIRLLGNSELVRFVFVGGGVGYERLREECQERGAKNVEFRPYEPLESLAEGWLRNGHVGLVSQKTSCVGTVVPSKVYALMAAGLPLVYIGPPNATPALTIERFHCGWRVDNGADAELVALLTGLARHPESIQKAGRRARRAFEEHYDVPQGVRRVSEILGLASSVEGTAAQPARERPAEASSAA